MICACRQCGESYLESKSTCEIKGYCSQGCMWKKLTGMGWSPAKFRMRRNKDVLSPTPFDVLKRNGRVGSMKV